MLEFMVSELGSVLDSPKSTFSISEAPIIRRSLAPLSLELCAEDPLNSSTKPRSSQGLLCVLIMHFFESSAQNPTLKYGIWSENIES